MKHTSIDYHKQVKYFAYIRKSTEGDEKQALSVDGQINKIKEQFEDLDVIEFFIDQASAFKPYNRPKFEEMITRIRSGEAQGVIAWHPDRLSRNEVDAGTITYMLREGLLKDLKFGSYTFELSPEGIWMLQMALSQSQYFSAKLGKDVKRGLKQKAQKGWFPGPAPVGYMNTPGYQKGLREIHKDPERFQLVRNMWDLMLTGAYTPSSIEKIVNEQWSMTTLNNRRIARSTIYSIFTNIFYTGRFEFDGEEYEGNHEAMVGLDEFNKVQKILGGNGRPRPKSHDFAFTGVMKCGECGCAITAQVKKGHTYYHCTRRKPSVNCSQKSYIREEELESQIAEEIESITILPEFKDWALKALNEMNDIELENQGTVKENHRKQLSEQEEQLGELTKMRYRQLIDDEEYLQQKQSLQSNINKIKEELEETERRSDNWHELTERTFEFATYALHHFKTGSLDKKREILLGLGQNFTLTDKKLALESSIMFSPIKKSYSEIENKYQHVRTTNYGSKKEKDAALASIKSDWLRGADSNRQPTDYT